MLEPKKEKVKYIQKSPYPYYIIAGIWLIGTWLLKMYKLSSYLILAVVSIGAYFLIKASGKFPDEEFEKEVVTARSYMSTLQQEFIEDGTKSLSNIKAIAEKIDNKELASDVNKLVDTSDKILDYVYEHADACTKLRKIVYYYLPTIEKLLGRYDEIEQEDVSNILTSKNKIESIVKTTADAFLNQYNDLFDTDTIDISSEVKVLEKVLVSEGLIDPENK